MKHIPIDTSDTIIIRGITDDPVITLGTFEMNLSLSKPFRHKFHVVTDKFNIQTDGIIGKDFLVAHNCIIDYSHMTFTVRDSPDACILKLQHSQSKQTLIIPPRCEVIRKFSIDTQTDVVVDHTHFAPGVYSSRTIINSKSPYLRVINTTDKPQIISNKITKYEPLANFNCFKTDSTKLTESRAQEIQNIISKNTPNQFQNPIFNLINKFSDVFALPADMMTTNNFYSQKLRVTDSNPIYTRNYRTPHAMQSEIDQQVNNLIQNNQIEPSTSPYNSPIILVPKKSQDQTKKWRMCIDYRRINTVLQPDRFPLPRIDNILDNLGRSVHFSVLDLYSGFHQVPIEPESREITAFSTEKGSFQWKVLPFGLNVSPNSFMRMMNLAFSGLPADQLFIYMDDIIVLGNSEQHHIDNLTSTLQRCRERNLKINPFKCHFFRPEVLFLGHICSAEGIKTDKSRFKDIENYPTPTNADEVRRFVAMSNFYRKFISKFSIHSIPLNQLTKKNVEFNWTPECQAAFAHIKTSLVNTITLAYPDYSKPFTITVDASKLGVGAVLSQSNRPIAFASKAFNKADRNKITIEQELIAIHWSINHFKHYIFGKTFEIQSDHKPLVYLFSLKDPTSKLARLRLDLSEYNFTISHIPGKDNVVADALSRIHINDIKNIANYDDQVNVFVTTRKQTRAQIKNDKKSEKNANNATNEIIDPKVPNIIVVDNNEIIKGIPYIQLQLSENHKKVHIKINKKYKTSNPIMEAIVNNDGRLLESIFSCLNKVAVDLKINKLRILSNDALFSLINIDQLKNIAKQQLKNLIIYVTKPLITITNKNEKMKLIEKFHEDKVFGGHKGIHKVYSQLKSEYIWKNMYSEVQNYISKCAKCQMNKPKHKLKEPMVITNTPNAPFELISIDTIGPLHQTQNGNVYAVTAMCELTKYLISIPIPDKRAETVAKAIINNIVLTHGPPKSILTDKGTEYVNSIFRDIAKFLNIELRTSTPYHHQTLGTIERSHRTFNEYVRHYLDHANEWEEYLRMFTFCYNTTTHSSFDHKFTPFELLYGRKNYNPNILEVGHIQPLYNVDDYAQELRFKLQTTAKLAAETLNKNKQLSKNQYDKNINQTNLNVGDKIIVLNENRNKFEPIYIGPYTIININLPNITYLDCKFNRAKTVHINNIQLFRE